VEDIPYRTIDGIELLGRLYRPNTDAPAPYVIDVHGGAWRNGDRLNNEIIDVDFAANGIGVFALDFRLSEQAQYPAPVDDVNYGIRWFKANAASIGANASKIGGLGTSSGAQQMGLNALKPNDPTWCTPEAALSDVDASVAFFVACWPILDPLARYQMVQRTGNERLQENHKVYFPTEEDMAAGNPYMLLDRGEATHTPPMIIVQGTADSNVEHTRADIFAERYRAAGGSIEVHKFEGQPHSFIGAEPGSAVSNEAIALLRNFVLAQG
jgi:acetyl esterase/lipase